MVSRRFSRQWKLALLAGTLSAAALPSYAGEVPSTDLQALRAEVDQLRQANQQMRTEVRQLQGAKDEQWLNERRAEEVKALVKEVLADADTRASLLEGGALTAGHNGKNFFLASEDGAYLLNIRGQIQARYIANFRNDSAGAPTSPDDGAETGFQIRRARLVLDGHIGSPKWEYGLQITANRDTTALEVEKAFVAYQLIDGIKVGGGRIKDNFLREESISDSKQLAVERSVVNQIFTTNYVEAVYAEAKPADAVQLSVSINDGAHSGDPGGSSTGFQNGGNDFNSDATDFAITGRLDLKLAGDWAQAEDFAAWSGQPTALFIGAAAHYELAESGDAQASGTTSVTGPYDDFVTYTADALFKAGGLGVYAAFVGQHIDATDGNTTPGSLDNFAALVQAGYFVIPDKFEPFIRYEWIGIDKAVATDNLNIVTVGANYYFKKHNAKLTLDAVWALDPVTNGNTLGFVGSSGTGLSGVGLLGDAAGQENQVAIRAQVQLLF
jgi:phosphate-selective porin OprO/OprP